MGKSQAVLSKGPTKPSGKKKAGKKKPIGVPEDFAATRLKQGYVPGKKGGGWGKGYTLSGGKMIPYEQQISPVYFDGDEYGPLNLSAKDRAGLQVAMAQAGVIKQGADFRMGVWDDTSRNAFKKLLAFANQNGMQWGEALDAWGQTELVEWGDGGARGAGGGGRKGPEPPSAAEIQDAAAKLRKNADAYLVPLSDQALTPWATGMLTGSRSMDSFQKYIEGQAKSLFPALSWQIDQGMTVREYAEPYVQTASKLLGINPADIDLTQPMWRRSIDKVDPEGKRNVMALWEWENTLKQDPVYRYDSSENARKDAAGLAMTLAESFGFMG